MLKSYSEIEEELEMTQLALFALLRNKCVELNSKSPDKAAYKMMLSGVDELYTDSDFCEKVRTAFNDGKKIYIDDLISKSSNR